MQAHFKASYARKKVRSAPKRDSSYSKGSSATGSLTFCVAPDSSKSLTFGTCSSTPHHHLFRAKSQNDPLQGADRANHEPHKNVWCPSMFLRKHALLVLLLRVLQPLHLLQFTLSHQVLPSLSLVALTEAWACISDVKLCAVVRILEWHWLMGRAS